MDSADSVAAGAGHGPGPEPEPKPKPEPGPGPAPSPYMPHYAVYRKDYQLFEILRPIYSKKDSAVVQKLGYDEGITVSSWIVCKSAQAQPQHQETILIKGKPVAYIYTGAELRPANAETTIEPIPIVRFLGSNHLPTTIRGIRVAYMDDLGPDYFTKKMTPGSKALHIVFRGEKTVVVEDVEDVKKEEILKEDEEAKEDKIHHHHVHTWTPHADDEAFCDQVKSVSFLSILCLFLIFAYYKNETLKHPYSPFQDTCHPDDAPFFMDPFSVAHP